MDAGDGPGLGALHLLAHKAGRNGLECGAHDPLVQGELKFVAAIGRESWRQNELKKSDQENKIKRTYGRPQQDPRDRPFSNQWA